MPKQSRRILRDYRYWTATKLHALVQRVSTALTDNLSIPASVWESHPGLLVAFFTVANKLNAAYHEALLRSIVAIAARDALEKEAIGYLDVIASLLEARAVTDPDVLLTCGFNFAKERRAHSRGPQPAALEALNVKAANDDAATGESSPA